MVNRYDLADEFPILTIGYTNFEHIVDEVLWIWQRKSNNVNDLKSRVWDWCKDETGSIGKACGYQLGVKHQYEEGEFDQVDKLLFDLKNNPYSRRIMTNVYIPSDLSEMRLHPCVYGLALNVSNGRLNGVLKQRSLDMLTAHSRNVSQHAVLLTMFAQVSGLKVGELIHVVVDAHIYDRHIPLVKRMIELPQFGAPKLIIDKSIKDFYNFSIDSFTLEDYSYSALDEEIPVAR
jgi:thymidylate synthase